MKNVFLRNAIYQKGSMKGRVQMKKISSIMMVIFLIMMSVSRAGVNRAYATDEKKTIDNSYSLSEQGIL